MTVTSTNQKVTFNGDGSTTVFAYNFKIFAQTDLLVILRVTATGTETTQSLTTNYTVSGVGEASGGNVTMGTAPASGTTLTILRVQPNLQGLDLVPNDPFPAGNLEASLDKLTFMVQTHEEEIGRSIKASKANTITTTEFTVSATDRANKVFAFDSSGNLQISQELGTYRGNWAASTVYAVRDLVKDTSTNNIFIAVTAHTSSGSQPLTTNTDAAKWALIVDAASATTSASTAATKASEAAASAVLASQWAIKTDATVDGSNFSAKYWATSSDVIAVAGKATEIGRLGTSANVTAMGVLGTSANVTAMAAIAGSSSVEIPALTVKGGNGQDGNFFLIADNSDDDGDDWGFFAKNDPAKTLQIVNNSGISGGVILTLTNSANLTSGSTATFAGNVEVGNSLKFENSVNGGYFGSISVKSGGESNDERTITLPDLDGTVALTSQLSGVTAGLVADLSPKLGGNLDVNGKDIVSTSNGAIELDPNGSGKVTFKGNATKGAGQFVLNCEQNSHGITIKGPPHSAAASYTLTLPNTDGSANEVLKTDGSGNLDWVAQSVADGAVTTAKIADNAVTTAKINADAVTNAKLADNSVDSEQYVDGSIDTAHLADSQITVAKMAANSIDSAQYVDGSIDTAHIADANVTQAKIAGEAINESKLQVSNSPTNGYFLSAQSGNTGGLTWAASGGGGSSDYVHISTQTVSSATAQVEFDLSSSSYGSYYIFAHDCAFSAAPSNQYCLYFVFYNGAYNSSSIGTNRMSLKYQQGVESASSIATVSEWAYNTTMLSGTTPTTDTRFGFSGVIGGRTNSPVDLNAYFVTGTNSSASPRIRAIAPNTSGNMTYMIVKPSTTTFAAGKFALYGLKDA